MKKRIEEHQLLALSDQALAQLIVWGTDRSDLQKCVLWRRKGAVTPLLSIGDMLEFLEEEGITPLALSLPERPTQWCDHLWAIVQILLEEG